MITSFALLYAWMLGMFSVIIATPQPMGAMLGMGCLFMILIT